MSPIRGSPLALLRRGAGGEVVFRRHCGLDPQSVYKLDAESRLCRDQHDITHQKSFRAWHGIHFILDAETSSAWQSRDPETSSGWQCSWNKPVLATGQGSGWLSTIRHCGPDPQSMYELDAESRLCRDQHDKVEMLKQVQHDRVEMLNPDFVGISMTKSRCWNEPVPKKSGSSGWLWTGGEVVF